jgi:DNA ligase-1
MVAFAEVARALDEASATRGRNDRVRLLGDLLRRLRADEVRPAVDLMLGRGAGVKSGVSWAALAGAARAAFGEAAVQPAGDEEGYVDAGVWVRRLAEASGQVGRDGVDVRAVHGAFAAVARARGRKEKERLLADLLGQVGPSEAAWLARNAVGEMRAGAQEGLLLEAIAWAADRPAGQIRRALIALGDVAALAEAALTDGGAALADLDLRIGRPFEWKLDGARVQIHKRGEQVWLWSRRMTDVTARMPDIADLARREIRGDAIVEGEVIVLGPDRRPIPFQDVMRRWLRQTGAEDAAAERPASVYLFDCLHLDGRPLIDEPYQDRWAALERARGAIPLMERLVSEDLANLRRFYERGIAAGHEGVMAKALDAPYAPGRRGSNWLKVKAETSLDLVIVGADWGTGRRHRWLSNYHLACRDEATGRYLSVGETFKGLTDREFEWMTARLGELIVERSGGYVAVRPEVVVEVLFNGVQRSTRLPSGAALRFARITRIREDKRPEEADTLAAVRALLPEGGRP